MLTDSFNRVHDYLRISLTERCNLRCFYCMPEEGILLRPRSSFMTYEEVNEIARIFVSLGVKKIRLTGGEPLIRNDAKQIIESLSKLNSPLPFGNNRALSKGYDRRSSGGEVELSITTNGILADEYIDTFHSCGITSINVSLDSLEKEKFNFITRRDYFDKVVSNINLLVDKKFKVKVNMVVIKGVNDDEVCDFVEWTRDKNVHVRFIEFMPFDGNKWDWSKGVSFLELMTRINNKYGNEIERLNDGKNDTAKNFTVKNYAGTFAIISSITNPFCDSCNRLRLTADGKMKNCLFSGAETDLLSAMRRGEDITPLILETVWNKKKLRGGIERIEDFSKQKNRTMVAIGG